MNRKVFSKLLFSLHKQLHFRATAASTTPCGDCKTCDWSAWLFWAFSYKFVDSEGKLSKLRKKKISVICCFFCNTSRKAIPLLTFSSFDIEN